MTHHFKQKIIAILLALLLFATILPINAYAASPIKLFVNGTELQFDVAPQMVNNRVLVPFRAILQALGAFVSWDPQKQTAYALTDTMAIAMPVGKPYATVNGMQMPLDASAMLYNSRVLIPVRFVATTLGAQVTWVNDRQSVYIVTDSQTSGLPEQPSTNTTPPDSNVSAGAETPSTSTPSLPNDQTLSKIHLGSSLNELTAVLGAPQRKDASAYGFTWYIYNKDYTHLHYYGIDNNEIVGIFATDALITTKGTAKIGQSRAQVRSVLGTPITSIKRGNTLYEYDDDHVDIFNFNNQYYRVFYDDLNSGKMVAFLSVNADQEIGLGGYFGPASAALREAFEYQLFDLTNASRLQNGLGKLEWAQEVQQTARDHSADMAARNFFSHTNPDGLAPHQRLEADGIQYRATGENLAGGQTDAFHAHYALLNSAGHRKNILSNMTRLGIGVAFGGKLSQYFTETFYTPQ